MSTTQDRRTYWDSLLTEQKDSGLTVVAWCQERNIQVNTFYYWRKHQADLVAANPEWVSLSIKVPASSSSKSLTVRVGAVSIDTVPGFDPNFLSDVLRVLEARC